MVEVRVVLLVGVRFDVGTGLRPVLGLGLELVS